MEVFPTLEQPNTMTLTIALSFFRVDAPAEDDDAILVYYFLLLAGCFSFIR
jgi:hypothetical protein